MFPIPTCNDDEIYDYINNKKCVPLDSVWGKRESKRQDSCYDRSQYHMIDFKTGKCINVRETNTNENCVRELPDIVHQCNCPICWIVSSLIAIRHSGIKQYFRPSYNVLIEQLYTLFSDTSKRGNTVCPRIPIEVAEIYITIVAEEDSSDINTVFNVGGYPYFFIVAFLIAAINPAYKLSYIKSPSCLNAKYRYNPTDADVIIIQRCTRYESGYNDKKYIHKVILKFIKETVHNFYRVGIIIRSGVISGFVTLHNGHSGGHSASWRICRGKIYICDTFGRPCTRLDKPSDDLNYFMEVYDLVDEVLFIGEKK